MQQIQQDEPLDEGLMDEEPEDDEQDRNLDNHLIARNRSILEERHANVRISDNRRPVYGVLTEPIRGRIRNKKDDSETYDHRNDEVSYIPKAHVQFLEQSGVVVVPISYLGSDAEIASQLKKVNGVYICGDSERSVANHQYQIAFDNVLDFVKKSNKDYNEYFPMFMMGKSSHSFIRKFGISSSSLQDMLKYINTNVEINPIKEFNDTFALHQLQFDKSHAHAFTLGKFFNRQHTGFRVRDLISDDRLKQWISPIATFKGSGDAL